MIRLAQAGENGMLWIAIAIAGGVVSSRRRADYVRAVEIVLLTLLANTAIKYVVRRARPVLEEELPALTPVLSGRSYPSAHASTSFAGARALVAAGLPGAPLHVAAVAMAVSRPYLGVHYPSDVVAGAFLGDAMARLTTP
jgi:decaprenylphosphoryl-5-phosphoribose phosphatase